MQFLGEVFGAHGACYIFVAPQSLQNSIIYCVLYRVTNLSLLVYDNDVPKN